MTEFSNQRELTRQRFYFTDKTFRELKNYIAKKYSPHRARAITVQQAVKEFLEEQERRQA